MPGLWLAMFVAAAPGELTLTAEHLLHDGKTEVFTASGRAKLTTATSAIDADRIVYDQHRNVVTAFGNVVARVIRNGKMAVVADLVTVRLDDDHEVDEVFLYDGRAFSKNGISNEKFLSTSTAAALEKAGNTQTLLEGNHLKREPGGWRVEQLELVPCECDFKNPSWSITSSSAVVDVENDRVSVTNPVVRVYDVPILWLPWLSLPLTDRQTGLLFPRPGYSDLSGFSLDAPVFITLGPSADLTLTPGFLTGAPFIDGVQSFYGVQGPRLGAEFRYAPLEDLRGEVFAGLLYDFRTPRSVDARDQDNRGTGPRGLRGEFAWRHFQDFGHGFGARVDAQAHTDGDLNRDLTVDVVARSSTYLRSAAKVFHRGVDHYVGLDVGLLQDIQWGYDWLGGKSALPGPDGTAQFGPGTLQRLPALTFGYLPPQLGPVRFEVEGDVTRLSPLFSNTGDEGVAASGGAILPTPFHAGVASLYQPRTGTSGVGDRLWQPGEREARTRLMLKPTVTVSAQPFGVLSASASASWRQLGWFGEASGEAWHRGYLLLDGKVETQVFRDFGKLRHVISPLVQVRALPFGVQSASPIIPYDAVDASVPGVGARVQGVVELRQRLKRGAAELLGLDVGQGLEFSGARMEPTPGEFYARLRSRYGWFSARGELRFDPLATRLASDGTSPVAPGGVTRAFASIQVDDGAGHGGVVGYENVMMEGTMASRQPLDLLFLVDRGYTSATRIQQFYAWAWWKFGPLSLRYGVLVGEVGGEPVEFALQQHAAAIGFAPACDCWRVEFTATQPMWPVPLIPNFGFSVTVARFGSIGIRR